MLDVGRAVHGHHQPVAVIVGIHQMLHQLGPALVEISSAAAIVGG